MGPGAQECQGGHRPLVHNEQATTVFQSSSGFRFYRLPMFTIMFVSQGDNSTDPASIRCTILEFTPAINYHCLYRANVGGAAQLVTQ